MQDKHIQFDDDKSKEHKNLAGNMMIINSFNKNVLNMNKKYVTSRKILYTKHSSLKKNQKTQATNLNSDPNKSASVVNLEFHEEKKIETVKGGTTKKHSIKGITQQRKTNYSTIQEASKRIVNIYKEDQKSKYHELFQQSVEDFFKNTLQIGPYAKSILNHKDIDSISHRKLINIQKIAFPMRQTRAQNLRNKTTHSRINQTTDIQIDKTNNHKRIKSFLDNSQFYPEQNTFSDRRPQSLQRKKQQKHNLLQALIPVRRPNNRKDYFVFGLSDRTGTTQNKIQMYRDMLWKVNFSNCLFVFTPECINNATQSYKFYVGPGNNCNLIKGILKRRFWWNITSNKNQQGVNFMWTQLKYNQYFRLQPQNKLPNNERSQKKNQKIDASQQDTTLNLIQTQFADIARIFNSEDMQTWKNHYKKNQKSERMIMENTYKRRAKLYQKKAIIRVEDSNQLRMHNHLECNYYIGNKKALFYNIKRFYQLQNKNPFQIIPHTFHIKKGVEDSQWKQFLKYHEEMEIYKKTLSTQKNSNFRNMWICKPGQNTNRGNGITVCYSLDDIKIRLNGRQRNRDGQLRTFILQKYIQNPLLYQKRKFDIRHYALISCINGIFKFYWYQEGYIRTSSSEFNLKVNRDPLIHLTNDAIQKNTPDYGKYQKGNKLSYQDFQKYLEVTYPSKKYNFYQQILPRMKQYAAEAFRSCYSIIDQKRQCNNFEVLGLDFMIDQNFQPWLIQINTNPCLQLSSPLLGRIIPHMIQNVFRLCVDPLFPPPQYWPPNKKTFFTEDPLLENKFTTVFDEMVHGKQVQAIFKDQKKIDLNMGKIQQEEQTYEDQGKQDWEQKNMVPLNP